MNMALMEESNDDGVQLSDWRAGAAIIIPFSWSSFVFLKRGILSS